MPQRYEDDPEGGKDQILVDYPSLPADDVHNLPPTAEGGEARTVNVPHGQSLEDFLKEEAKEAKHHHT
jgi:hypothetical protein